MSAFYSIPVQKTLPGPSTTSSYTHVREIQSGTFATVSLFQQCHTPTSSTQVAVKKISSSGSYNRRMIANEISVLNALANNSHLSQSSKNICRLLEHFPSKKSSTYNLVFEYCQYGDLYDFLKFYHFSTNLDFSNFLKTLINDITDAIKFCHDSNVYHRDIKPENIFITDDFLFKLGDFGLLKLASVEKNHSTRLVFDDWDVGTDKYMAPECIQSNHKKLPSSNHDGLPSTSETFSYDIKYADYWSWGITLFYTMFAKVPFLKCDPNVDSNFKKFINAHIRQQLEPLLQKLSELTDLKFRALTSFYANSNNGQVLDYFTYSTLFKDLLDPIPENRSLLRFMESRHDYFFKIINEQQECLDATHNEIDELEMEEDDEVVNFDDNVMMANQLNLFDPKFSLDDNDDDDDYYNYEDDDCFDKIENLNITTSTALTDLGDISRPKTTGNCNNINQKPFMDVQSLGTNFVDTPLDTPIEAKEIIFFKKT